VPAKKKITIADFEAYQPLAAHFRKGQEAMRALDQQADVIPHTKTFTTFEFADFLSELTPKRLELLRLSQGGCRSIADLAIASRRDPSAVSKDVSKLKKLGLVTVVSVLNAGHGKIKLVKPIAETVVIQASIA
jgi:predicted transcriptional regulator